MRLAEHLISSGYIFARELTHLFGKRVLFFRERDMHKLLRKRNSVASIRPIHRFASAWQAGKVDRECRRTKSAKVELNSKKFCNLGAYRTIRLFGLSPRDQLAHGPCTPTTVIRAKYFLLDQLLDHELGR